MSFKTEGTFKVVVVEALLAEPKFSQAPAFDVALRVQTEDGQSDWWRGEVSGNYGKGNAADKTQAVLTLQTLEKIGWQHQYDFSQIHTLVGVQTEATVVAATSTKGGTFYNVKYLGGGGGDKPVAVTDFASRWAALTGVAPVQQAPPPPPVHTQQAAPSNPFTKPQAAATTPANPFAKR